MKKILAILLFISFSFSASAQYIEGQETSTSSGMMTTMMVWNDADEHGCIGSAWYTWNEEKSFSGWHSKIGGRRKSLAKTSRQLSDPF